MENHLQPTYDNTELIPLSADAFIAALQGKTVTDENGVERCFLQENRIIIKNVFVIDEISLKKEYHYKTKIDIINCVFQSFLDIEGGRFTKKITINNCTISLYLSGGNFSILDFQNSSPKTNISISSYVEINLLQFNGGNIYELLLMGGRIQNLKFIKGFFELPIIFQGTKIDSLTFKGGNYSSVNFIKGEIYSINIQGGNFQEIKINNGIQHFSSEPKIQGIVNRLILNCFFNDKLIIEPHSHINQIYLAKYIGKDGTVEINNIIFNRP